MNKRITLRPGMAHRIKGLRQPIAALPPEGRRYTWSDVRSRIGESDAQRLLTIGIIEPIATADAKERFETSARLIDHLRRVYWFKNAWLPDESRDVGLGTLDEYGVDLDEKDRISKVLVSDGGSGSKKNDIQLSLDGDDVTTLVRARIRTADMQPLRAAQASVKARRAYQEALEDPEQKSLNDDF